MDWLIKPCPSLATSQEPELHHTAETWMALAGVTIPRSAQSAGTAWKARTRVLRHHLATHLEMTDSAIGKMMDWYAAGGETEIGL